MLAIATDLDLLKTLATTLIDSVEGYRDAAAHDEKGRLRDLFLESAKERRKAVERLQQVIRGLGGDDDVGPSFNGQVHQLWLDLKVAMQSGDEDAILDEVEFGESYLQQKFQAALEDDSVKGEARAAIEEAYQSVCARYEQIRSIRWARKGQPTA